eukprot:6243781-Pyramimonas_sp.AAC.1
MIPRPPKWPTRTEVPMGSAPRSAPPRPRRVGRAMLAGRRALEHAPASAAAEMHQPTPSIHRNRRRMCSANQVAGGRAG